MDYPSPLHSLIWIFHTFGWGEGPHPRFIIHLQSSLTEISYMVGRFLQSHIPLTFAGKQIQEDPWIYDGVLDRTDIPMLLAVMPKLPSFRYI